MGMGIESPCHQL